MNRSGRKKIIVILLTLPIFYYIFFNVAFAQNLKPLQDKKNIHPMIASSLEELARVYEKSETTARLFARNRNIKIEDSDKVTVYFTLSPDVELDDKSLQASGAKVIKGSDNLFKVRCPIDKLDAIAENLKGLLFIKPPDKLLPSDIQSEGVDLTGAVAYHSAGYFGSGITVAVIDVGFAGLSSAISDGELPDDVLKVDCTGNSCVSSSFSSETEPHGTAVAEIIYDMAPGVSFYLIKVSDTLDLKDAKDYVIAHGIRIINHSLVISNTNFYDGQCWFNNPVCTANDAKANNVLWVSAVGNEATRHYEAFFTDTNNNGWHNVSGSDESINIFAQAGSTIRASLTWDAWPVTDQDYDLYLFNSSDTLVASSISRQQPSFPTEEINYYVPITDTYYLAIFQYNATSNHRLEVYSAYHDLVPAVASSSLLNPADADGALAVGAIDVNDWNTGPQEFFTSQGPTNDGRIKPDISGPDNVLNYIYAPFPFAGTSASCAHVTGAAALILNKYPGYSVDQLWSSLISSAIDMGSTGKDNIYGYGRLNLPDRDNIVGSNGDGGGGCFIATAAYGSLMEPHVQILRKMRDRFLLTNRIGKSFVNFYYKYSPLLADFISKHDKVKIVVRWSLLPLVGVSWIALKLGLLPTIGFMLLCGISLIYLVRLKKSSRKERHIP